MSILHIDSCAFSLLLKRYTKSTQTNSQNIKDRYAAFDVPYYGKDNDDYVNGGGFCCDDSPKLKSFNPSRNDNPELFQYYYHSDHLGSSSLITNLDGETVQHIEYVPFGEVFIEERNNTWNTPYLFNAKELDEETGLYYYGARYYNPRTSIWLRVDPLAEKLIGRFPYEYCYNNPTKYLDPNGKYGSDGHYWTVYAMGISMGLSNEQALKYALHAENYDNVVKNTGIIQKTSFRDKMTWLPGLPGGPQQRQHGLIGGSQEEVNSIAHEGINSGNLDDLHLLGDSYAHATESSGYKIMYPKGRGHANYNADNIGEHTNQYNKYLNDLAGVMSSLTGFSGELDRTVFDLVGKSKNADVRTDILKAFIASKVGQKYETDNYIKSGKINELKSALDELGIKYKESKVVRTSFIINDDN